MTSLFELAARCAVLLDEPAVHLPARFARCGRCHRLITVDGLNPHGRCTRDCGDRADELDPDGAA